MQFTYSGDQVYRNHLVIRNNETNVVVYDQTQVSFQLKHILPASTLLNGNCYNAQIQTSHKDGTTSAWSNKIIFYCFTSPVIEFTNLESEQIIKNSSYEFTMSYIQPQGELLSAYKVSLYDSKRSEIYSTELFYDSTLRVNISGLIDNYHYYIRCTGITVHNMEVDSGYLPFSVEYIRPSMFAVLDLENLWHEGCIMIQSNIIAIEGTSNPDPPIYIDDKWVDLSNPDHWVKFEKGFSIEGDFTLQLIGRNFNEYSNILTMSNYRNTIEIKFVKGNFVGLGEVAFFILESHNGITAYTITSNYIAVPFPNEKISLWIRRKGDLYEIKAEGAGAGSCFEEEGLSDYRGYLYTTSLLLKDRILYR